MPRTIVWISGATQGIGAALARSVPYPDARVINISRRRHPELETIVADLSEPASWDVVSAHFADELATFEGERAIFIHNANYAGNVGFAGETDPFEYRRRVLANVAAPLVLGDAFVRACRPGYESGLVMISSATAKFAMQGMSVYGAGKAGMEQWVRTVRRERAARGTHPMGGGHTARFRGYGRDASQLRRGSHRPDQLPGRCRGGQGHRRGPRGHARGGRPWYLGSFATRSGWSDRAVPWRVRRGDVGPGGDLRQERLQLLLRQPQLGDIHPVLRRFGAAAVPCLRFRRGSCRRLRHHVRPSRSWSMWIKPKEDR